MKNLEIKPDETLILFADLQEGIADLPLTVSHQELQRGVSALSRLAGIFKLPAIVSAVMGMDGSPAKVMPQVFEGLGDLPIHYRSTADSLKNEPIRKAIEDSGRKTLLIAGVATEIAVQLPAITASVLNFNTYVVIDAVAGISSRTEMAAIARMQQAGVSFVSVAALSGELAEDFSQSEAQQALSILFEVAQGASRG